MVRYVEKLGIIMFAALPLYLLLRIVWVKKLAGRCRQSEKAEGARISAGAGRARMISVGAKRAAMISAGAGRAGMPKEAAMTEKVRMSKEVAMGCFVLFHIGLLALALEGEYGSPAQMAERAAERIMTGIGINLVPFRTITSFFVHFNMDIFLVNIVGNIIMFMPWGFGIVLLWKRNRHIGSIMGYSLLLPLFIETSQLFIGRSVDVDDLILNFAGGCLGASIYFLLKRKCGFLRFLTSE